MAVFNRFRLRGRELAVLACLTSASIVGLSACGESGNKMVDPEVDAGIGGNPDAMTPPTGAVECQSMDGTRLKREYLAANSEAREEYKIVDTTYGTVCQFQVDSNTQHTCYPTSLDLGGTRYFQDSACTSALVAVSSSTTPKRFHRTVSNTADNCFSVREYLEIGSASPVSGGQTIYFKDSMGTCNAINAPTRDYYVASPASFLSATLEPVTTERLSGYTYVGSDGSSMCSSQTVLRDSMIESDCRYRLDEASTLRCLPETRSRETFQSDSTCGLSIEVVRQTDCEPVAPKYSYESSADVCNRTIRTVYSADETAQAGVFSGTNINNCVMSGFAGAMYYEANTEAPPSAFLTPAEEVVRVTGERIAKRRLVAENYAVFSGWYDTQHEIGCDYRLAADDITRCLPNLSSASQTLYTDSACTSSIQVAIVPPEICGATIPQFFGQGLSGGRRRILAAELIVAGTLYAGTAMGPCSIFEEDSYKPAFEVSASSFQAGEVITD